MRQATLTKPLVTIPTVSAVAVFDTGSSRIGYVHFRNFVTPSIEALNAAFDQLLAEGATDLVLDLRYNGGGLVSVAQHLGGLIGGAPRLGQIFVQFPHNDKQSSRNLAYRFEEKPQALTASRLVVITTRGSASASETIVNGLRPHMDVRVVGDTTFGKPVGQYGFDFCDKVFYPVSFLVTNAGEKRTTSTASPPTARPRTTSTTRWRAPGGVPRRGAGRREERSLRRDRGRRGRGAGPLPRACPADPARRLAADDQRLVAAPVTSSGA